MIKEKFEKPIKRPNRVALESVLEIDIAEDKTITVEHAIDISISIKRRKPNDSGRLTENTEYKR